MRIDKTRLLAAIARFSQANILVIGDVMLDEFIWGKVSRISPEAPVPVVEVERQTRMLGGAANVLHNLTALGARPSLCGLIGDDRAGRQLLELLDQLDVPTAGLVAGDSRPTTLKTRVVAHSQQVVRVDRESRRPISQAELDRLYAFLNGLDPDKLDAIIVSDYAKGLVSSQFMDQVRNLAGRAGAILAVDPKVPNMPLYAGATVVTPNHHEAIAAAGADPDAGDAVGEAGRKLLKDYSFKYVLVTQGEMGMTMFGGDSPQGIHIPTTAKRVFDVTGAGDTVISTLTLGLACGLNPVEASALANLAAGLVVGEVGTSAVTGHQLSTAVDQQPSY